MPSDNFSLNDLQSGDGDDYASPGITKDLEAVYDIPVQISAVLGKSTM